MKDEIFEVKNSIWRHIIISGGQVSVDRKMRWALVSWQIGNNFLKQYFDSYSISSFSLCIQNYDFERLQEKARTVNMHEDKQNCSDVLHSALLIPRNEEKLFIISFIDENTKNDTVLHFRKR